MRLAGENQGERRFSIDGVEGTYNELQQRFATYSCPPDMCDNIRVSRCVIWCDWGRPLEIGARTQADEICDILFEDCDLIHNNCNTVLSIQNCDRALCRDITYRDIRVELDDEPSRPIIVKGRDEAFDPSSGGFLPVLIGFINRIGFQSSDEKRGCIRDICLENISVTAPEMPLSRFNGLDDDHRVEHVEIRNLCLNDTPVRTREEAAVQVNEFTDDISIK